MDTVMYTQYYLPSAWSTYLEETIYTTSSICKAYLMLVRYLAVGTTLHQGYMCVLYKDRDAFQAQVYNTLLRVL